MTSNETFDLTSLPPVPADLAAAVTAAPTVSVRYLDAEPGEVEPDFATLFAAPAHHGPLLDGECAAELEDCPGCQHLVSPRVAWLLHTGARLAVDNWVSWSSSGEDFFAQAVEDELPPVALRHAAAHPGWLAQMAATVRDIGLTIASGQVPAPSSTAEEMALHIVLANAAMYLETCRFRFDSGVDDAGLGGLPAHCPEGHEADLGFALDEQLEMLGEVLFEDHDVLMLFNPKFDGLESDEYIIERMGLANLHPKDWFKRFLLA